jgi:hypothetical protein
MLLEEVGKGLIGESPGGQANLGFLYETGVAVSRGTTPKPPGSSVVPPSRVENKVAIFYVPRNQPRAAPPSDLCNFLA